MSENVGELALRPFEERDFYPLVSLIAQTWLADFPGEPGELAATVELCDYLSHTTWSLVAERDGAPLGAVLLAEKDGVVADADEWRDRGSVAEREAARSPEATLAMDLEMAGVVEGAGLALDYEKAGAPEAAAALKLLIVSPEARGLGLGRRLLDRVRAHLRERGAAGYYLLTDDNCDVSFYDHMGLTQELRRRSEVTWPGEEPGADFGIYVYSERL
ncbi:GNAT family N-acetyltransferase [Thermophilibacter provencensis]|uniref:GNAT family N-acetyltransferase n=1 Tax=Thermophilibacter provencensis TaxID=1852386 RepID=A0ABT7V2M3_9ACTN|nr:GNAT family N-acetyltransferase [Thermophilibacter provencensis]MDM8270856.1 GNAT family N-acetyltransferase [Thermophilibacter provencensis]